MSFSYYQTATRNSPEVRIDGNAGILMMRGSSSPENVRNFYDPVFKAVDDLDKASCTSITATFDMIYFNTGTSKCFFVILKKLEKLKSRGKEVMIEWFYEEDDESMHEIGEDYSDILGLPFEFKEVKLDE